MPLSTAILAANICNESHRMTALMTESMTGAIPATMQIGAMTAVREIGLRSVPVPKPGQGEVLVRLRATALRPREQRIYSGEPAHEFPIVRGQEMAGEAEEVG